MLTKVLERGFSDKVLSRIKAIFRRHLGYRSIIVPYNISPNGEDELKGKVALVTGGSGVIGRAIACRLAADGVLVYVSGTNVSKIKLVVDEIRGLGGTAYPCKIDLKDEEDIISAFELINTQHQRLDILVNCAGGSARTKSAHIFDLETHVIDRTLNINLRATMLCTREGVRIMKGLQGGHIINISSIIGERGKAKYSEYAVAKAGIIAFTKSVAMELGKFGINVNCISSGIVYRDKIYEDTAERLRKTNYLNSYGKPEDVSEMVAFLVSSHASFITGQNIIIDGGRSLGLKGD